MATEAKDSKRYDSKVIESKTIGFRKVLNTDWPRTAYLSRDYHFGRIDGYKVEVICNGINDSYREFKTRREAQAAYDDLGPEVDRTTPPGPAGHHPDRGARR